MDLQKIERLLELARRYELHEIELQEGGDRIRVTCSGIVGAAATPASVPVSQSESAMAAQTAPEIPKPPATTGKGKVVKSPFVGTFYRAPSPGAEPFVEIGKRVAKGDTLCIIEAMKLMNEIEAEEPGTIAEILVENGQPVEFDQPLFIVQK